MQLVHLYKMLKTF